ncbi:pentapeptide repeat-containing protein [Streptomyces sp. DSM 40473]|uniref:Pentapeptide repeat-containing protein n=2 Tax=Streptomyces hesseae TaxID=3075519 RepID=A0ABU2SFR2_9ACTN|nr:pentapeptide repeat-containing protein [Streptomyces sp. DSM 40473]
MTMLAASTLPGVAALVALFFTWMQVSQNSKEVRVAEHGEVTNRYNTAIQNLASANPHIRLGGIYALDRIMQDSPRDEPAVVSVLSEYVRKSSPLLPKDSSASTHPLTADLVAALAVISDRPEGSDSGPLINLSETTLRGLDSSQLLTLNKNSRNFRKSFFRSTDMRGAVIGRVDFTGANIGRARLSNSEFYYTAFKGSNFSYAEINAAQCHGADFTGADFTKADLIGTNFDYNEYVTEEKGCNLSQAILHQANLTQANLSQVPLQKADLSGADLTDAIFTSANLRGAELSTIQSKEAGETVNDTVLKRTDFSHADLRGADLREVDFSHCNLEGADLRGAKLDGARLKGAKLDGARGVPAGHD